MVFNPLYIRYYKLNIVEGTSTPFARDGITSTCHYCQMEFESYSYRGPHGKTNSDLYNSSFFSLFKFYSHDYRLQKMSILNFFFNFFVKIMRENGCKLIQSFIVSLIYAKFDYLVQLILN